MTPPPPATASKARLTPKPPRTSARPPAVAAKAAATKSDARPKAKTTRSRKTPAPPEVRLGSHAEGFFAEGEAKAAEAHEDDARLPVNSIFAPAERPEMAKFVMIALALCAAIAVFALVRALTAPPPPPHESLVPPDVPSAAPSPIPPVPALAAVQPSATPSTAASAVAVSDASAPMLAASASPADLTLDGGAPLVAVGNKTASEEKIDARKALERGKSKDAVEAASRSIALDPTDADAWLILGAANMELGKSADAHTAFAACAKEATKGPIGECRSMLH